MANWSRTWTFFDNDWHEGNPPILGPRSHAFWQGSSVFDGARAFEGVTPDLDRHCTRINDSARALSLKPIVTPETWLGLVADGLKKFDPQAALYIRPTYWAEEGAAGAVPVDPESTRFCLCIYEAEMPQPGDMSITLSPFRRPTYETMPVNAKAGCLYPNNGRAIHEARARGFDSALMTDMLGNVAELASSNVFMAKDGVVYTPVANGTFLAGITRTRVLDLLRAEGITVVEGALSYRHFQDADEIFSTGNYSKVIPITRIDDRHLQPGPFYRKARELYWEFAHAA